MQRSRGEIAPGFGFETVAVEADGFVETRGRNGTVVSAREGTTVELLQLAASDYATRARDLGIDPGEALGYVKAALGQ